LYEGLSAATRFRLKAYTPCLAARYDELKEQEQNKIFEDPNWVFTEKQNGVRGWLIVHNGEVKLFSRNYSDVDCSLLEYWNNVDQNTSFDGTYAIDVEIKFEPGTDISKDLEALGLETDSPLEAMVALLHTYPESAIDIQEKFKNMFNKDLIVFRLIAPLYFNGKNYVNRTLGEGQDVYKECVKFGQSIGLNVKEIDRCDGTRAEKEVFLNTIINNGGEGIVAHNRKGNYCTLENRSKTSFIKLKRSVKAMMEGSGLGDSFDAFVGGFTVGSVGTANEGIIGALNFYIYINNGGKLRKHWIASIPNIMREERKLATWNNADGLYPQEWTDSKGESHWMSLNPDFDGMVGECTGQALSSRSIRLEHPSLVIWRTERMPESCEYTQEFIDSQTTASAHNTGKISY
jgi:ATP-dependent DNA ligase